MKKLNTLIAKSSNGTEIIVSLIPLNKMQNTRDGFKSIEVGKRVLLQSGIEVDLNLDGKLTKITKHAKRHFWLNDVCTCHGLLPSHSA